MIYKDCGSTLGWLTVLAQNYPTSIGFINHFSAVVRRLAVELATR